MKIYASFDKEGFPIGFYPDDIYSNKPENTIEITEEQWHELLLGNKKFDLDNNKVIDYIYELSFEEKSAIIRKKRDSLIKSTDYFLMSDYPINNDKLEMIKMYRQELRDITKQETFPDKVSWPSFPEI